MMKFIKNFTNFKVLLILIFTLAVSVLIGCMLGLLPDGNDSMIIAPGPGAPGPGKLITPLVII